MRVSGRNRKQMSSNKPSSVLIASFAMKRCSIALRWFVWGKAGLNT